MVDRRDALLTYRYLRIGMVGAVGWLASAVVFEVVASGWSFLPSISSYWYTPARPVFVSSLVAVGIALIVLKGTSELEDVLLNIAGLLAPVVALVPTPEPGTSELTRSEIAALVNNNVAALLVAGLFGIIVAAVLLRRRSATLPRAGSAAHIGLLVTGVLYVATLLAFLLFRDQLLRWGHTVAAVGMFLVLAAAVFTTSRTVGETPRAAWLTNAYRGLASVMVITLVAGGILHLLGIDWVHQVLLIEVVEVVAFAVFWALQTSEHWNPSTPTSA